MAQSKSLGLASAAACLGALVAVIAGRLFYEPRSVSHSGLECDSDGRLATELHELGLAQARTAAALARLELALQGDLQTPALVANTREAMDAPARPESLAELVESLDALRETLARESAETRELMGSAPAFGGETMAELKERRVDPDWTRLANLEKEWRFDQSTASHSQLLQSERDLLRAYGPPSAIYRPKRGGLQFVYRAHPEGEAGPAWYFQLQDGFVVEFFIEDET